MYLCNHSTIDEKFISHLSHYEKNASSIIFVQTPFPCFWTISLGEKASKCSFWVRINVHLMAFDPHCQIAFQRPIPIFSCCRQHTDVSVITPFPYEVLPFPSMATYSSHFSKPQQISVEKQSEVCLFCLIFVGDIPGQWLRLNASLTGCAG